MDRAASRDLIAEDPSDEELDRYILTRLALAGVDLSVLPEDDPAAPADRRRILRSARRFLRERAAFVSRYPLDPAEAPPILYPAALPPIPEEGAAGPGPGGSP